MITGTLPALATAALLGAALLASAPAALAEEGDITVKAPRDGAVLGEAGVVLSGTYRTERYSTVDIALNGRALPPLPVRNGVFTAKLTLAEGENRVTLKSPSSSIELTYQHGGGGDAYRFHPGYAEEDCGDCHQGGPGVTVFRRHDELCYGCHDRKDEAAFLHGPVGAGQCVFCHDPHGSASPAFLTARGEALCSGCHTQPSSRAHMEESRGRECVECHDPHGAGKKYFLR